MIRNCNKKKNMHYWFATKLNQSRNSDIQKYQKEKPKNMERQTTEPVTQGVIKLREFS